VQKYSQDYGKFENGNKLSYSDFEKLLLSERKVSFLTDIKPKIIQSVKDCFQACGQKLYRGSKEEPYSGFELLGFDFMLDADLNVRLIEVNTNPCLDTPCLLLSRLIPQVLDQTLKLTVDPFLAARESGYLAS
jgi:hypothetical protein